MQIFDMPPDFADYPEHDHADDGQEEVYVVLRGTVELEVDGRRSMLDPGRIAHVGPGTRRKLHPGPNGARVLALGGVPGQVYSRPADFRLGAPDPTLASHETARASHETARASHETARASHESGRVSTATSGQPR